MLTMSKVFTFPSLLCLCGNKEYPGSFLNKLVSSFLKWVCKYILFLAKLKGKGTPFWIEKAKNFPLNYLLHVGVMLTITKVFMILILIVGSFRKKSLSSPFSWVSRHISSWPNWRREDGLFWRVQERGPDCEITPKSTWLS